MAERLDIEVVFRPADRARHVTLAVPRGTTVRQAIERARGAGLEIDDLSRLRCGIYGRECSPDAPVADGDRVELYRPLLDDPKTIRRRRAAALSNET